MRFDNWPELLNDYLILPHKFDWVTCNCALFAANGIIEITGEDFAEDYRHIKTKRGMINKIVRECNGSVVQLAIDKKGEYKNVSMAGRGDIVSYKFAGVSALGICNGVKSVFVSEDDGKVFIPTLKCNRAWTI